MKEKAKKWLLAAGARAIRTVAQTAIGVLSVATAMGEVDWVLLGSSAALAGIISLLQSLQGLPELSTTVSVVEKTTTRDDLNG